MNAFEVVQGQNGPGRDQRAWRTIQGFDIGTAARYALVLRARVARLGCARVNTRVPLSGDHPRRLFDFRGFQNPVKFSESG
jgi:hypothetical protein